MAETYLPIKNKCILIDVDLGVYFESNDEILSYNDIHFKLKNNEPFVIKNLINHKKANFVDFSHDFILGSKAGRKFFLQEVFSADPVSSIWEVENGSKFLRPKETKRLWTPYL